MARFHLDHNVAYRIAMGLSGLGHDVVTAYSLGLDGADDDVHLLASARDDRILVTNNGKDFLLLHKAWRRWSQAWGVARSHAGILIIPQWPHLAPDLAVQAIHSIQARVPLANELYAYDWQTLHDWEHEPVS